MFELNMKRKLNFCLSLCFVFILFSCSTKSNVLNREKPKKNSSPIVYAKEKFDVLKDADLIYAKALSRNSSSDLNYESIDLKLDVYYPDNKITNRPLYFFIHGGGFKEGSKSGKNFVKLANYYASRGWVFVSIDYRLKKDFGLIPEEWSSFTENAKLHTNIKNLNAIYPAVRDAKAALRWVIENAESYHINKDYVTVSGGSAGAMIGLAVGISDLNDFTDELSFEDDYTLKETNINTAFKVKTIISHWGSKLPLDIFENIYGHNRLDEKDPPLFIAHGMYDQIVDIEKAQELASEYQRLKIPHKFYPIDKKGHGLWNATVNNKKLEELALNFIVEQQNLILK